MNNINIKKTIEYYENVKNNSNEEYENGRMHEYN